VGRGGGGKKFSLVITPWVVLQKYYDLFGFDNPVVPSKITTATGSTVVTQVSNPPVPATQNLMPAAGSVQALSAMWTAPVTQEVYTQMSLEKQQQYVAWYQLYMQQYQQQLQQQQNK
jgi:hypothetical protein